jgi:hypothetical protein
MVTPFLCLDVLKIKGEGNRYLSPLFGRCRGGEGSYMII